MVVSQLLERARAARIINKKKTELNFTPGVQNGARVRCNSCIAKCSANKAVFIACVRGILYPPALLLSITVIGLVA